MSRKYPSFSLTILGRDRAGIIAKVTGVLYKNGVNLEDASMTILEGQFAMILLASLKLLETKEKILAELRKLRKTLDLIFYWSDIHSELKRGEKHKKGSESYLITAFGKDRTGIMYEISRLLYALGLNITDLNSRILGSGKKSIYAMLLEFDVPKNFNLSHLANRVKSLQKKLRIEIQMRPTERLEA